MRMLSLAGRPLPDLRRGKGSSNRLYSISFYSPRFMGNHILYLLTMYAYGAWFYFTSARDTACSLAAGICTEKILH